MAVIDFPLYYGIYIQDPSYAAAIRAGNPDGVFLPPSQAALFYTDGVKYQPLSGGLPPTPEPPVPASSYVKTTDFYALNLLNDDPTRGQQASFLINSQWEVAPGGGYQDIASGWAGYYEYWDDSVYGPPPARDWNFTWIGQVITQELPATTPPPVTPTSPLQTRVWVNGFEAASLGGSNNHQARAASRTVDGQGLAYRGLSNQSVSVALTGLGYKALWQRLYIRLRVPAAAGSLAQFLRVTGGGSGASGAAFYIDETGAIRFYNQGLQAFPGTLVGTSAPLTVGQWYKLDILVAYSPGGSYAHGQISLYINGTLSFTAKPDGSVGGSGGLSDNTTFVGTTVGTSITDSTNVAEFDLDDWIGCVAAWDGAGSIVVPSGVDWQNGSHVQLVRPTGFASGHNAAAWAGDYRSLVSQLVEGMSSTNVVTSSTSGSQMACATDYADQQIGCAALVVYAHANAGGTQAGAQLGYRANGATVTQVVSIAQSVWEQVLFSLTGASITAPSPLSPLDLIYVKNGSVSQDMDSLLAAAELIGVWGREDAPSISSSAFPPYQGKHNSAYPNANWAQALNTPTGGVAVWSGVYTGNSLGQDILTQIPAHWFFARLVPSGLAPTMWYTGLEGAHNTTAESQAANRMIRAVLQPQGDGTLQGALQIAGKANDSNLSASTYQWVAFSDPAMRFLLSDAFARKNAVVGTLIDPLVDTAFTPVAGFFFREAYGSGTTARQYYKGPGHTGSFASLFNGAESNTVVTMSTGQIATEAVLHSDQQQAGYALWRVDDGSGSAPLIAITSYVGNGAGGTRDITLALGGLSPLFALVVPHNAASWQRDPSHTGVNSCRMDTGANGTTSIVGGNINTITVGVTLNALNIVYDVFVIGGPPTGGWAANPTAPFSPIGAIVRPSDGPFVPVPPTPTPLPDSCISFGTAVQELSERLGDPNAVHWTSTECQQYLREALRTWNAYTQTRRDRGTFQTVAAQVFYDLPTLLENTSSEFIRAYTLTDQDLVTDLEYALMEPPTPTTWTGTAMFTLQELTDALVRRRDRFLRETGCRATRDVTAVAATADGRYDLPADVITVRRAAWTMLAGTVVPLLRTDEWGMNQYKRTWPTAAVPTATVPTAYSVSATPPVTVQVAPPPSANGSLDIIATRQGAALDPTTGVLLGIPDDYAWAIKFGALADLLSQGGPANDPVRAARCEQRFQQGVKLASRATVVLDAYIEGALVNVYALSEADLYARNWQNLPAAQPTKVLLTSQNLVALTAPPDGVYTVTLDVVRNQPVPTALSDCFIEGGNSVIEPILAYAQYLALFKEGPSQFEAAQELLNRFLTAAGMTEMIDQAQMPDRRPTFEQQTQDVNAVPRKDPPMDVEAN